MKHDIPRTGKELADFHLRGKIPTVSNAPETPLLKLLKKIPRGMWSQLGAIKLSPKLGFNCSLSFSSAHQLANWLGDGKKLRNSQRLPYMSYWNKSVQNIELKDLLEHSTSKLTEDQKEVLKNRYRIK